MCINIDDSLLGYNVQPVVYKILIYNTFVVALTVSQWNIYKTQCVVLCQQFLLYSVCNCGHQFLNYVVTTVPRVQLSFNFLAKRNFYPFASIPKYFLLHFNASEPPGGTNRSASLITCEPRKKELVSHPFWAVRCVFIQYCQPAPRNLYRRRRGILATVSMTPYCLRDGGGWGGGGGGEVNKILFRVLKSEPAHAEGTTFVV